MGQAVAAAVTVPRSSSLRFLRLLKQPTDSDQNPNPNPNPNPSLPCPLELDDVFRSRARSAPLGRGSGGQPRPFVAERRGLSAALGGGSYGGGGDPVRLLAVARAPAPEGLLRRRRSAPVAVPAWPKSERVVERGEEEEEEEEEEEGMVLPPHVMIGRASQVTTPSVVEGAGRTLKGRDLRRVRNAVLERTGFLD